MDTPPDFYTVEDAARVLERTPGRVRQLLRDGTLMGEGGGDAHDPWRIYKWSVHALKDESPRRRWGGQEKLATVADLSNDRPSEPRQDASEHTSEARELWERVEILQRELGRLEGRLELTQVAESTIRESLERERENLERERERADAAEQEARKLREELEHTRRSWWRRLFGG